MAKFMRRYPAMRRLFHSQKKFQFCISSDAQTAIKQHQDALEQAIVVSTKDPDEILQKLKDSGSAIDLSDLRDDE